MRTFEIKDYKELFEYFPENKAKKFAYCFLEHLCEYQDLYMPYPDIDDPYIYMKIPSDGSIYMVIPIDYADVKLQFKDNNIFYTIEDYKNEDSNDGNEHGSFAWDGQYIPNKLYNILFKNPARELLKEICNDFTAILSKFEKVNEYSINNIVPKAVSDIIKNKADIVKNVQTDVNICTVAYNWDNIQVKPKPEE